MNKTKNKKLINPLWFTLILTPLLIVLSLILDNGLSANDRASIDTEYTVIGSQQDKDKWTAPKEFDKVKNPLKDIIEATKEGKKIFDSQCFVCHGTTGIGDGIAGAGLNPKPANLISENVQQQSDGAIFWKIWTGRPPMAAYKETMTKTKVWQLVTYIRELAK